MGELAFRHIKGNVEAAYAYQVFQWIESLGSTSINSITSTKTYQISDEISISANGVVSLKNPITVQGPGRSDLLDKYYLTNTSNPKLVYVTSTNVTSSGYLETTGKEVSAIKDQGSIRYGVSEKEVYSTATLCSDGFVRAEITAVTTV